MRIARWKLWGLAGAIDAGLLLAAAGWAYGRGEPGWTTRVAWAWAGVAWGVAGAVGMGIANVGWYLFTEGLRWPGPRQWISEWFRPLFGGLSWPELLLLSAGAGWAEEAFFRGVVQADLGWIPASLLFGLLHTGHREMIPFGLWAAAMGLFLGGLYLFTGNLLAPMVAHGLYDFGALCYIRYGVRDPD